MRPKLLILNGAGFADPDDDAACRTRGGPAVEDLRASCAALCRTLGMQLDFRQAESQDQMLGWMTNDGEASDALIVSPTGCSPVAAAPSPAYYEAVRTLASLQMPVIEVHAGNVFARWPLHDEPPHRPAGDMGLVCGLGVHSYLLAIRALAGRLCGTGGS